MGRTVAIPNFIQGVSQQGRFQIRPTQLLAQLNCVNSPSDGAVARPGAEVYATGLTNGITDNYYAEFRRGEEDYLLEVFPQGAFRIYNLLTGAIVHEETVTITMVDPEDPPVITYSWAGSQYLASASPARDVQMQMIGDYLFLVNKTKTVSMRSDAPSKSPKRPYEGVIYIRAGAYSTIYTVCITHHNGTVYEYAYETPDNSAAANAQYINTDHIAAALYRAMTGGSTANVKYKTGGSIYPEELGGQGQNYQGAVGTSTGVTDLTTLGYSLHVNGSSIHIWNDTDDFKLDADAGANSGTNLIAFEEQVVNFSRLPNNGFANYVVKVLGTNSSTTDDYYVKCTQTGSSAAWVETVKPDIPTQLDAATMPVTIRIDNVNTFTPTVPTWGKRVVGDETSDPDPLFVGQRIKDLFFNDGRLGVITEDSVMWSKLDNPYVFFRSSVQTQLDNDPIPFLVNGSSNTAVLERAFVVGGQAGLWSQGQQFAVRAQDSQFSLKNVSIKQSTAYDFVSTANPGVAGQSFIFASDEDSVDGEAAYAVLRDLLYQEGKLVGETDITAHIPHYIPNDVSIIACSDTKKTAVVFCPSTPTKLYVYNWFIEGEERTQSAWQTWTFDDVCSNILWVGFFKTQLRIMMAGTGNTPSIPNANVWRLCRIVLSSEYRDPGGEFHTRLDLRMKETDCSFVSYDDAANQTRVTLRHSMPRLTASKVVFVIRQGLLRGKVFRVAEVVGDNDVIVNGDLRLTEGSSTLNFFYVGWPIYTMAQPSLPVIRDQSGETLLHDEMTIETLRVAAKGTVTYKALVTQSDGTPNEYVFGDEAHLGTIQTHDGVLKVPVRERDTANFSLMLVNDTPFPSSWQFGQWTVDVTLHEGGN